MLEKRTRRFTAAFALVLAALAQPAAADDALGALKERNPLLARLAQDSPAAFAQAAGIIAQAERAEGHRPEIAPPPPGSPVGRDMTEPFFGTDVLRENPDLLWFYNASPEGMHDLIGLLKSAGSKPSPK